MIGHDYVAVERLSTKKDETLALPGERCTRVPAGSLPWLIAQGLVVPAEAEGAADAKATGRRRRATAGGDDGKVQQQ